MRTNSWFQIAIMVGALYLSALGFQLLAQSIEAIMTKVQQVQQTRLE